MKISWSMIISLVELGRSLEAKKEKFAKEWSEVKEAIKNAKSVDSPGGEKIVLKELPGIGKEFIDFIAVGFPDLKEFFGISDEDEEKSDDEDG